MSKPKPEIKDFIKTLLMPLIFGKTFVFYFGIMYSNHPGEGYGYALIGSILFTLANMGRFLWKYRDVEDI